MKDKILKLFFENNLLQKDIVKQLNVSKGLVSRIVTKDSRYENYKKEKILRNKQKHNKQIQNKVEEKRKQNQFKKSSDDLFLKAMHEQATMELSKRSHLSDESYRKWNYSAYTYNPSKNRYEFNEELGRCADIPKYVKNKI